MSQPAADPWSWTSDPGTAHIRFLGKRTARDVEELRQSLTPPPEDLAWLRQIHSARVLQAAPGRVGTGDALVTPRTRLALAIATADCVPVLLSTAARVAAVHAGWRGLVAGVLEATLERLEAEPARVRAWIGPAIGACCYEVGEEVAARLRAAADPGAVRPGPDAKPHADLQAIARHQLHSAGVERIDRIELCTRCHPELLWSYRRDGEAAGRNWAVVWRE